ncbi:glycosyltransferase 87 family protein [Streptomyces sp. NPDC001941]|uniref:glycosyltransferase 87 family protein n=1 Tax=Streptomyces sp. NPDC001941 TaxID=3154659 RepID=UPI00331F5D81
MTATVTAPVRARRLPLAAAATCLLSFALFWWAQRAAHVSMVDLRVYRAEGATALAGRELYDMIATESNLPNTYPPFASLLFIPLTLPDVPLLRTLATAGNLLLLVALVRLSLRLVGRDRPADDWLNRPETVLWVSAVLVWCEPVWTTLRYGQINLLLAVAVLWDFTRRPGSRWAGVGTGLAAAVKLTPALFVVFTLVVAVVRARGGKDAGPWLRQSLTAIGTFLAATAVGALALPRDSHRFWTEVMFQAGRVGKAEETANQSLRGVLARLLHTEDPGLWWLLVAVLAGAAGLALAVRAGARGDVALGVVACAVTALLVSPISWSHHWVWCVPALLLLKERAGWKWAAGLAFAFGSFALWWVPHTHGARLELHQNGWQMLASGVYVLAAAVLLAKLWRTQAPAQGVQGRDPGRLQAVANE